MYIYTHTHIYIYIYIYIMISLEPYSFWRYGSSVVNICRNFTNHTCDKFKVNDVTYAGTVKFVHSPNNGYLKLVKLHHSEVKLH